MDSTVSSLCFVRWTMLTGNINTSTQMTLTSATFFGTPSLKPVNENKANMRWGTTDERLLHHSHRKKPTRSGKDKPQTATLISMHVLRFAQLHSDWSLHKKPVRMKQNCSPKVRETPLLPPLKKEQKRKAKTSHFALFRFSRPYSCSFQSHSGSSQYISVSFRLVPVHSCSILVHPFHSGVILPRSGIFRLIPVYSVPFHSAPVFSNAYLCSLFGSCVVCEPLDRYVGRHLDRQISRYVGRHIDRCSTDMSVDIATDISVEGCWSSIGRYVDPYDDRYVGRYVDRCSTDTSVDIAADIRPIR